MNRVEELLNQIIKKERDEAKKCNVIRCIVGIILLVATIAGIAYAVYRFMKPDYLEDYEDDIDDEFDYDDDFFDEEDDYEEEVEEAVEKAVEETLNDVVDDTVE